MEGAARCTHSANSNEAATGFQAQEGWEALSEVSADEELTGHRESQMSKHMNKWSVTRLITTLAKCSENIARGCTTRDIFLWPLHLKWKCLVALPELPLLPPSVPLGHITCIMTFMSSFRHLVHLLLIYMVMEALGLGTPCLTQSPLYVRHLRSGTSTQKLFRDSNLHGMRGGPELHFPASPILLIKQ